MSEMASSRFLQYRQAKTQTTVFLSLTLHLNSSGFTNHLFVVVQVASSGTISNSKRRMSSGTVFWISIRLMFLPMQVLEPMPKVRKLRSNSSVFSWLSSHRSGENLVASSPKLDLLACTTHVLDPTIAYKTVSDRTAFSAVIRIAHPFGKESTC